MAHLREEEKAKYVQAMFRRISRRYDLLNTVMSGGMHYRWRRMTAEMVTGQNSGLALDAGTGTGDFAFTLARRPQVTGVVGLDFSPEMLALAEAKATGRGLAHRVRFVLGDALALPFTDDSFCCATSGFNMRNVTDVGLAVSGMARVVAPGGKVGILDMFPLQGKGPFNRLFRAYFQHIVPWLGAVLAGSREAYTYLPKSVEGFLSPEGLATLMAEAGLKDMTFRKTGLGTVYMHVGTK